MDFEHKIRTPQKKYFVMFVCCMTGFAIAAFLIFGHLLSGYIAYAVDKQKAQEGILVTQKNHEELKEYLRTQEDDYKTRLSYVKKTMEQRNNELAERDAKIKSQQEMIDKINVLSNQFAAAKNEYIQLQSDLKTAQKDLDDAKSSHTIFVAANEDLQQKKEVTQKEHEAQKISCLKDIALLDQIKDSKEKDIKKLSAQKTALESYTEKMNEKILLLKQDIERSQTQLSDEQLELSSVTTQLTSLSSHIQKETKKLSNNISDQNNLQVALAKVRSEKAELSGEVAALEKKKVELQAVEKETTGKVTKFYQQKGTLEGDIIGLQERVDFAQMALNRLKSQIRQEEEKQSDEKKILDSEIDRLKSDYKKLVDEVGKLTVQKNKLDAEIKDMEEKKKQEENGAENQLNKPTTEKDANDVQ